MGKKLKQQTLIFSSMTSSENKALFSVSPENVSPVSGIIHYEYSNNRAKYKSSKEIKNTIKSKFNNSTHSQFYKSSDESFTKDRSANSKTSRKKGNVDSDIRKKKYEDNPDNWTQCKSSNGRTYWFNFRTERSQWETPKPILFKKIIEKESKFQKYHFSNHQSDPQNISSSSSNFLNKIFPNDHRSPQKHIPNFTNIPDSNYIDNLCKKHAINDSLISIRPFKTFSNSHCSTLVPEYNEPLIKTLHPLQQALLIKKQLQKSLNEIPCDIRDEVEFVSTISLSPQFGDKESSTLPLYFATKLIPEDKICTINKCSNSRIIDNKKIDEHKQYHNLSSSDIKKSNSDVIKFESINNLGTDIFSKTEESDYSTEQTSSIKPDFSHSNLESKLTNTSGILIKKRNKKTPISQSPPESFQFSNQMLFKPFNFEIPELLSQLHHNSELVNPQLIFAFSSGELEQLEKQLTQSSLDILRLQYMDNLQSQILLIKSKLLQENKYICSKLSKDITSFSGIAIV